MRRNGRCIPAADNTTATAAAARRRDSDAKAQIEIRKHWPTWTWKTRRTRTRALRIRAGFCASGQNPRLRGLDVLFDETEEVSSKMKNKYAMPFQQKNSFFDKGISWTIVLDIDRLYVTANFLMNVSTCFNWNQLNVASVMYQPVLENLLRQADPVFQVHRARLCLAIFLSSTQLLRNLLSLSSLLRRRYSVL